MPSWSLLALLSPEQAFAVRKAARRRRFRRGEVVFHRGDPADTMHLITEGSFAVRVHARFGDIATLDVLGPGQCFGELALLRHEHARSAAVEALSSGETLCLSAHTLDQLRHTDPALDRQLIKLLSERVTELTDRLVDALYTPATQRVQRLLEVLADQHQNNDGTAVIHLTHNDLASLAGTSRLTVERVLHDLRQTGRIHTQRGKIMFAPDRQDARLDCSAARPGAPSPAGRGSVCPPLATIPDPAPNGSFHRANHRSLHHFSPTASTRANDSARD